MKAVSTINLILAFLLISAGPVRAQTDALDGSEKDGAAGTEQEADLCNQVPDPRKIPEIIQSGVHEFSCRGARWLDSLFGDSADFDEDSVGGKLSLGVSWNEFDGLKGRARFRVQTDLPNFNSRWNGFIGRLDEETYISDTETLQESPFRQGISDSEDNDWLLGLGYKEHAESNEGWDISFGLRFRTPIRPYTKLRYRKNWQLSPAFDLRYRQTFFYRRGTGFGTTTHLDSVRDTQSRNVLRWEMLATWAEDQVGTRWWLGHTWYRKQTSQRGVSLRSFVRGESGSEVPLQEYGFELTVRRQLAREWLFINVGPTLTWPRERLHQKREASFGFAVLMEFEFGQYRR
jgi:hypothetical protein